MYIYIYIYVFPFSRTGLTIFTKFGRLHIFQAREEDGDWSFQKLGLSVSP